MDATAVRPIELDEKLAPGALPDEAATEDWFRELISRGINFHPEETFAESVDSSGARTFRPEDAGRLDALMEEASGVCDPVTVAMRLSYERLRGADKAGKEVLRHQLPAIDSRWRLIREIERHGEEVAPYCAYGTVRRVSEGEVALQIDGVLSDRLEEPPTEVGSGDGGLLIVWSEGDADRQEQPSPALAFLEDAIPIPSHEQAETLKRERKTFDDGAVTLIRPHPVSLLWPFSTDADFPFNALCVEMQYRHLEDPRQSERSVMLVIAEDGGVLLREDWA